MTALRLPLRWGQDGLPAAPGRVLLVQISAMGDQLQTLPAVSDIAARWPGIAIDWVVDARFAEIPRLHPAVRRVFALPLKTVQQQRSPRALQGLLAMLRELRAERYDLVWDPHSVLKSAIISRLARSRLRVGYRAQDCGGEPLAARAYTLHFARPPGVHGTEGRRVFAQAVLDTDPARAVDYAIDQRFSIPPDGSAEPTVFLAHGASKPEKLWPLDRWQHLARWLTQRGLRLQLTWGNAAEHARALAIVRDLPAGSSEILDRRSLTDMLAVIAGCRLLIGVDTGFTHMAAALRRPVVGLFVATGAELFTPTSPALARTLGGYGVSPEVEPVCAAVQALLDATI
ncbi:MAG: lipopolysaccharide heptosyltransferase I [Thiomonas sp.]